MFKKVMQKYSTKTTNEALDFFVSTENIFLLMESCNDI